MKQNTLLNRSARRLRTAGWLLAILALPPICEAQDSASNLPAGVQDVVRLVKAGLGEQVVMAQINHVGATYSLADSLLRGLGVNEWPC